MSDVQQLLVCDLNVLTLSKLTMDKSKKKSFSRKQFMLRGQIGLFTLLTDWFTSLLNLWGEIYV